MLVTPTDNLQVRVTGALKSIKDLEELELRAGGTTFRLGDFATVKREYQDPPQDKMRFNGKEVIGLGVSMEKGGNIIEHGQGTRRDRRAASRRSCRSASSCTGCRTSRARSPHRSANSSTR